MSDSNFDPILGRFVDAFTVTDKEFKESGEIRLYQDGIQAKVCGENLKMPSKYIVAIEKTETLALGRPWVRLQVFNYLSDKLNIEFACSEDSFLKMKSHYKR